MLAPLVLVLTIAFATVFVFSDESLVIEIDYEEPAELNDGRLARCERPKASGECGLTVSSQDAIAVAVVSPEDEMRRNDDRISEFVRSAGLRRVNLRFSRYGLRGMICARFKKSYLFRRAP